MICLELNRFFYGLSRMLHLSEFVWTLRSSVLVVFNNFLLKDATDRSKISSDQKRIFIALSLHPLSFFANTPFKMCVWRGEKQVGEETVLHRKKKFLTLSYIGPRTFYWNYGFHDITIFSEQYLRNFICKLLSIFFLENGNPIGVHPPRPPPPPWISEI